MKSLPTLRERWNQLIEVDTAYRIVNKYNKYVKFTAQKLALWMFVPCNSKGEPMEKIERYRYILTGSELASDNNTTFELCQEYEKALDTCIFEGWEIVKDGNNYSLLLEGKLIGYFDYRDKFRCIFGSGFICETIEDLITAGIPLTLKPNHAKELNL